MGLCCVDSKQPRPLMNEYEVLVMVRDDVERLLKKS